MSKNELSAKEKRMIESVKENPFNFRRYKEEDQFEELVWKPSAGPGPSACPG